MSNNPVFGGELRNLQPPFANAARGSARGSGNNSPANTSPTAPQFQDESKSWPQPEIPEDQPFKPPTFKPAYLADSRPQTPVEAPTMPFAAGSEFDLSRRFGSVSSIATTDDDESANIIYYPWDEQQDQLVKSMYEELLNMPQMTPFSGRYPPSGVLHRVAKNTLRMAKHRKIYFPHSMNAVRQRVMYFYHEEPEVPTDLENYNVPNDYFSLPLAESHSVQPVTIDSDDFVFSDVMGSVNRRQSIEEKYSRQGSLASLQPAFKESSSTQQPQLTEEDVVNIVAKRKRDSLRMKRGPN